MVYFRYVGEGSHPPGIYRFSLADTAAPRLPEFLELDGEKPAISPCGTKLAFWRYYELWVRDLTTGNSEMVYFSYDSLLTSISWLGCDTIIYSTYPYTTVNLLELSSRHATPWQFLGRDVTVSNDRRTWAFQGNVFDSNLYVFHDADLDTFIMSHPMAGVYWPRISPNGQNVVFGQLWSGKPINDRTPVYYEMTLLNISSGTMTTLIESWRGKYPTWVDDSTILYVSLNWDRYHSLWLTDLTGHNRRLILDPLIFFPKEEGP
jgi:Tol biopolymer transport system component